MSNLGVLFRVPRRDWAESAIEDLATAGCRGELLQGPDCEGCWTVLVTGPDADVLTIRHVVSGHAAEFCWEAFLSRA